MKRIPTLTAIFDTMPRQRLKSLLRCKDSLASEVARGKKPVASTRALASVAKMLVKEHGRSLAGQILIASLEEWFAREAKHQEAA